MTLILGVDPSAGKIAVVGMETMTGTPVIATGRLYSKGTTKQTPEALGAALTFMSDLLEAVETLCPDDRLAYVEEPLVGRGGAASTIKQAYVGGIVRGCLAAAGFRVYGVHPSTWRSTLNIVVPRQIKGGAARTAATKAATRTAVVGRWPKIISGLDGDHDLIDAAAIALHGQEQHGKAARHFPPQPPRGAVQA